MSLGLKRDQCLIITGLTKNQFYYVQKGTKPGRSPSDITPWRDPSTLITYGVDNADLVQKIVDIKLNPDKANWYRMITVTLQILGYYINHKKVYRLMREYILLEKPRKRAGREIDFFKENHLNQVFTHPYTPEENRHIESFHNTLGKALNKDQFTSLKMLEQRLKKFYACYNNERSHSSIKGIAPSKFWALYELNKIEVIPLEKRRIKFELKVAYQDILTIPSIDRYDYRAL